MARGNEHVGHENNKCWPRPLAFFMSVTSTRTGRLVATMLTVTEMSS